MHKLDTARLCQPPVKCAPTLALDDGGLDTRLSFDALWAHVARGGHPHRYFGMYRTKPTSVPGRTFCDIDGEVAGQSNSCIAVSCSPGTFETCRGDLAITCNGMGTDFDLIQCPLGCDVVSGGCKTCGTNDECQNPSPVCDDVSMHAGSVVTMTSAPARSAIRPLVCVSTKPASSTLPRAGRLPASADKWRHAH